MPRKRIAPLACAAALLFACGSEGDGESTAPTTTKFGSCPDDSVPNPGSGCTKVGVPEGGCGSGFVSEGSGCRPILPASECAKGTMALAGDTTCREIAPCGELPAEASVFVDRAYVGGASDGSRAKPFTTIAAAIAAAPRDATIAINDGTYAESLTISKPLKLVGRCPAKVEVRGGTRTISVRAASTIRDLAVTGAGQGLAIDGVGVVIENVWVHDTASSGIVAFSPGRDITVKGALIEDTRNTGAYVEGAALKLEGSVIRNIVAGSDARAGTGVQAQISREGAPANVAIHGSILEHTVTAAVVSYGSSVTIESSLLRDVRGRADAAGCVIASPGSASPLVPQISIVASVLEGCAGVGASVRAGTLLFDHSVVRDVRPDPVAGRLGLGLDVSLGATLTVRDSLVEKALSGGIFVGGSNGTIERTIVRDVTGQKSNGTNGAGIAIVRESDVEPLVTIDQTLVLRTHTAGIYVSGGTLTVSKSAVRSTEPQLSDGKFGDGVEASATYNLTTKAVAPSTLSITDTLVRDSARAGIVNLASTAKLARSLVACAPLDIALGRLYAYDGAAPLEAPYSLADEGGMACGCDTTTSCRAQPTSLEPIAITR